MSDLRESGSIEQDSSTILFLYRDELYNEDTKEKNIAEVALGKNRHGSTGMVKLHFNGKYTKFSNISNIPYQEM
jgi:replicative DNA helicase